jgi:hypothetical protein
MDEPRLFPLSVKGNVLPHVQPPAANAEGSEVIHQWLDDMDPSFSIHGERTDIDVGRLILGRWRVRIRSTIIITMHIQENEVLMVSHDAIEKEAEHLIVVVMDKQ